MEPLASVPPQKASEAGEIPLPTPSGDALRAILLAGSLAAAMGILNASPLGRKIALDNLEGIRRSLAPYGVWGWGVFCAAGTGLISFGFPRVILSAVAGALFGTLPGTALGQVAATLGAAPAFLFCRRVGRDLARRLLGDRGRRLDRLLEENGFLVFLLIRLFPVGNAFLTSCLAGMSGVPFSTFLAASFIGFLPETFIFALLGGGFAGNLDLRFWGGIALLLLFSLVFIGCFFRSVLGGNIRQALRKSRAR